MDLKFCAKIPERPVLPQFQYLFVRPKNIDAIFVGQTGIPNLVRATKTDNFQMCAILLALIELDCHSRECQTL